MLLEAEPRLELVTQQVQETKLVGLLEQKLQMNLKAHRGRS
jgi:hypothetical protein